MGGRPPRRLEIRNFLSQSAEPLHYTPCHNVACLCSPLVLDSFAKSGGQSVPTPYGESSAPTGNESICSPSPSPAPPPVCAASPVSKRERHRHGKRSVTDPERILHCYQPQESPQPDRFRGRLPWQFLYLGLCLQRWWAPMAEYKLRQTFPGLGLLKRSLRRLRWRRTWIPLLWRLQPQYRGKRGLRCHQYRWWHDVAISHSRHSPSRDNDPRLGL